MSTFLPGIHWEPHTLPDKQVWTWILGELGQTNQSSQSLCQLSYGAPPAYTWATCLLQADWVRHARQGVEDCAGPRSQGPSLFHNFSSFVYVEEGAKQEESTLDQVSLLLKQNR